MPQKDPLKPWQPGLFVYDDGRAEKQNVPFTWRLGDRDRIAREHAGTITRALVVVVATDAINAAKSGRRVSGGRS